MSTPTPTSISTPADGSSSPVPTLPPPSILGLWLFALYCLLYFGFMAVAVYDIGIFDHEVFTGVNLAIFWGMGLIGGAFVLALIYVVCGRSDEDHV